MAECTIPALLAAIQLLTQSVSPSVWSSITAVTTPCDYNRTSSHCYEYLARGARAEEDRYREVVTDVVAACAEPEPLSEIDMEDLGGPGNWQFLPTPLDEDAWTWND